MPKGSKSAGGGKRGDSALYKGMGIKLSDIVVGGESSSRASFAAADSGGAPPRSRLQRWAGRGCVGARCDAPAALRLPRPAFLGGVLRRARGGIKELGNGGV